MNGIEDLVRETLAERAHDVDHVQLNAPAACQVHSRRWVAIGTVVAVAAAILVAVVLVAPWHSTGRRAGPATLQTPPAGMQWVSYHGITLTVPESWRVSYAECIPRDGDVVDLGGVATTSCPYAGRAPQTTTVSLGPITDDTPRGEATTIAGHPALRTESILDSSPQQVTAIAQLTQVGIALTVSTSSPQQVDAILGGLEYTPVGHYGCTAQLTGQGPVVDGGLGDVTSGVVCDYTNWIGGVNPQLIGSRVLTADEIAVIEGLVSGVDAVPGAGAEPEVTGRGYPIHEYLLATPAGTTSVRTYDPTAGGSGDTATFVLDGKYEMVPGEVAPGDLPGAYP